MISYNTLHLRRNVGKINIISRLNLGGTRLTVSKIGVDRAPSVNLFWQYSTHFFESQNSMV